MGWIVALLALAGEAAIALLLAPFLFPGDGWLPLVLRLAIVVAGGYALGVAAAIAYGAVMLRRAVRD